MKIGKLDSEDLKELIDNNRGVKRDDVRISGGIGEDCSVVEFGDYECVLSTDPITGAEKGSGKLAVHINCNDIASCGVKPLGILVTILAPKKSTIEDIKEVMCEINKECEKLHVAILGGHTEVTEAVNKMVVSCTAIGKTKKNSAISTNGAKIGDDIIVTKKLGMEGTFIAVSDNEEELKGVINEDEVKEAKDYINHISVVKEGELAGKFGANSMHDITEGGVLGALWEVTKSSGCGFLVYDKLMPLSAVTLKVCSKFKIDPLRFISSGSMLITAKDGSKLVEKLKENKIEARIIGKVTKDGQAIVKDNFECTVQPPKSDELFKISKIIKNNN